MSKWEKLLRKLLSLSKDMRFNELQKILEYYGYVIMHREVEVDIILFVNQARTRLQFLNMNQLKRYMLKWCEI